MESAPVPAIHSVSWRKDTTYAEQGVPSIRHGSNLKSANGDHSLNLPEASRARTRHRHPSRFGSGTKELQRDKVKCVSVTNVFTNGWITVSYSAKISYPSIATSDEESVQSNEIRNPYPSVGWKEHPIVESFCGIAWFAIAWGKQTRSRLEGGKGGAICDNAAP